MKFMFRVDASIQMGAGHVMRCLTLADQLKEKGHVCTFICRAHTGHLNKLIISKGHGLYSFEFDKTSQFSMDNLNWNKHAHWLGVSLHSDSQQTKIILKSELPDWLVVDHYALDSSWEKEVKPFAQKLMVIDDLADRKHESDLLLDQTFGREGRDYLGLVPKKCEVLAGSYHSLLRQEFAALRPTSLRRRGINQVPCNILISMGSMDKDNYTSIILKALQVCSLPNNAAIKVVLDSNAPWVSDVMKIAADMPWSTEVVIDSKSMAELMSNADLAIGAAGSTSWERCCLGLPTIQMVTADNQQFIAQCLSSAGAIKLLENIGQLPLLIRTAPSWMSSVSKSCRLVTDGRGVERVVSKLEEL